MSERVFLVTGGAKGIGAAICTTLAAQGAHIAIADLDADGAQRQAAALGPAHRAYVTDVSDEAAVVRLFDQIETAQGQVSGLVCAAGLLLLPNGERPLIKDMTLDLWERSFAVNTRAAFLCSREYLRRCEARPVVDGRVIFFGSVAAQLGGYRSSAAYIGAKAGLMGYAKAFAREAAHLGITANTIAPGLIDTDMLRLTVGSSGDLQQAAQGIPLGRVGQVEDVAAAVGFLASPQAGYMTGTVMDINGGYRMQ